MKFNMTLFNSDSKKLSIIKAHKLRLRFEKSTEAGHTVAMSPSVKSIMSGLFFDGPEYITELVTWFMLPTDIELDNTPQEFNQMPACFRNWNGTKFSDTQTQKCGYPLYERILFW